MGVQDEVPPNTQRNNVQFLPGTATYTCNAYLIIFNCFFLWQLFKDMQTEPHKLTSNVQLAKT